MNFEAVELQAPLVAHNCYFDEPVNLMGAKVPQIRLTGCRLPALAADQVEVHGDLDLSNTTTETVALIQAQVGGALALDGTQLTGGAYPVELGDGTLAPQGSQAGASATGIALVGDRLQVGGGMRCRLGFKATGYVRLVNARICGGIELGNAVFANDAGPALLADFAQVDGSVIGRGGMRAEGEVSVLGAHIAGNLELDRAALSNPGGRALNGQGLRVDGSLKCRSRFATVGALDLNGCSVGGDLDLSHATLSNDGGWALIGDGIRVGDVFGRYLNVSGEFRLLGAHVSGNLDLEGATLANDGGWSLNADGLRVEGSAFLRKGFGSVGAIRMPNARIGNQLDMSGARLEQYGGWALWADRLTIDGDAFCRDGFVAHGSLSMTGAQIAGDLSFDAATLDGRPTGLDLSGACIQGTTRLVFADPPPGQVDLTNAQLGRLEDSETAWPTALRLRGCVYRSVTAEDDDRRPEPERRLRWIARGEEEGGFFPQPYTQLMQVCRAEGRDGDARQVGFTRERRRRTGLGIPGRLWSIFLQATVGYGFRPLRAAGLLGLLIVVGTLAFSAAHAEGDLTPVDEDQVQFIAAAYTMDRLIPVVSFGYRDAFVPAGATQWLAIAYTIFGWALMVAVLGGLNAAVRRE